MLMAGARGLIRLGRRAFEIVGWMATAHEARYERTWRCRMPAVGYPGGEKIGHCQGRTKSEARAHMKRQLGLHRRLPVGTFLYRIA